MSDLNTMMQDMKAGFRRIENQQHKFEEGKRKNMDRYFQQVLNQKKQKYFEDLQQMQTETGGRSSTVDQLTSRVQTLKRHMHNNKDKAGSDMSKFLGQDRQRNQIKFTKAGFPIHDYIKEMREEREKKEFKSSHQVYVDPSETAKHAHLKTQRQQPRDILKVLQDEMEQERNEREERLKYGGIESLNDDERQMYEVQLEMKKEQAQYKAVIHKLITEDMNGIDQRQFEQYKHDEMFMDEWTKQVIETILVDDQDSPILGMTKELLKLADKELYRQVRDRKITLRQFKTRCMEKLNGNQFAFIDYDDVEHLIHPDCRNLDLRKINKWSKAVYGKPFANLSLKGEDSFINKLQDWQVQPRCLKSISNFSLNDKKRSDSADFSKRGLRNKLKDRPQTSGWNFQKDQKRKKNDQGSASMDATTIKFMVKPAGSRQNTMISPKSGLDGDALDGTDRNKSHDRSKVRKPQVSAADDFYKQIKQFQINNGYLLRMLDDGLNVVLTDELKARLYMTADDAGALSQAPNGGGDGDQDPGKDLLARKAADPTYGMTSAQKERHEKRMRAKPRPRDLFNVQDIIKQRDQKQLERRLKLREEYLRKQDDDQDETDLKNSFGGSKTRDAASGGGMFISAEQVISYKSIPNQVFGGPIPEIVNSSRQQTGRSGFPTERRPAGPDVKIRTATGQYHVEGPIRKESFCQSLAETHNVTSQQPRPTGPSADVTPMTSAIMIETQQLLTDKEKMTKDVHTKSGEVSPAFRSKNISSHYVVDENFVKHSSEQINMEQIRLMNRHKVGLLKPSKDNVEFDELKVKISENSQENMPNTPQKSKLVVDDLSSQYRDKNQAQNASSQNDLNLPLKSNESEMEAKPDRKKLKKKRTVIDLLQQPENKSPSPHHMMTDPDEFDAKEIEAASLKEEAASHEQLNETPELEALDTQPLIKKTDGQCQSIVDQPLTGLTQLVSGNNTEDSIENSQIQHPTQISNVNIHLLTPQNKMNLIEEDVATFQHQHVKSDDGVCFISQKEHPSLYPSQHSELSRTVTSGRRTGTGRQSSMNLPPPVIPLYQLDKYMVKPSVELKKKRMKEKAALEQTQNRFGKVDRLRNRYATGGAMTIRKSKGNVSSTFRGCMLKATPGIQVTQQSGQLANANNQTITSNMSRNPYESGDFSPRRQNLLRVRGSRQNTSSQELVRVQARELSQDSATAIEQPRVSHQFWQFLNNMQIPTNQSAVSQRNNNAILAGINSQRDGHAVKTSKYHMDLGSSIDGMNINSQTRTGYQTSDLHAHEQSMSQLERRTVPGAIDENFDDLRSQAFSSMPSPGVFGTDRMNNSQENFAKLLNYTRQHQCAQTMLEYEKQKNNLKSQYSRSPQNMEKKDVNANPYLPQSSNNNPNNGLNTFEHHLVQQSPGQKVQHLSIESANRTKSLLNQAAIRIEEVDSQFNQKGQREKLHKINTDLLPTDHEDGDDDGNYFGTNSGSNNINKRVSNRSNERLNDHVSDIINDVGENLQKTKIDIPHADRLGVSRISNPIPSQSVMLVKGIPHGRDENLIVNSQNYTRTQLQKQQQKYKEDDGKTLMAMQGSNSVRGPSSPEGSRGNQSVMIEMKGYSISRDRNQDGGIKENSIEESSITECGGRRKGDYILRQNHRLRNVMRQSHELKIQKAKAKKWAK